jgi:taurine dioxygenase
MNTVDDFEVIPTGGPVGAEVRGVDFSQPVGSRAIAALNEAWAVHQVLLFRDQLISDAHHISATAIFGEPAIGASRSYFEKQGRAPGDAVADHPEIAVISNLGPDGDPVMENEGLGSGEVVWHSDNSYIETPPAGSFLRALEVPPSGGNTSFTNQYLAYDTLPEAMKVKIAGLFTKQDSSRNSAGVLRPGVVAPESLADVPGPSHPLVRVHPVTGRKALYLGRRRLYPSRKAKNCSISYGITQRRRSLNGRMARGRSVIWCCGTIAASCIIAIPMQAYIAASCIAPNWAVKNPSPLNHNTRINQDTKTHDAY